MPVKSMTNYKGLTAEEVNISRQNHGNNILPTEKKMGFWRQYLSSFGDPIIKILLVALSINIIFMFRNADWYESAGIALAVFLATFVSTLSEYGSEQAFEKLKEDAQKTQCRVKRNGYVQVIPIADIVVGDLVLLQAGERVPADGIIIDGSVTVDQSPLNGESIDVEKSPSNDRYDQWDLAHSGQAFSGSNVVSGEGIIKVERVGGDTFYGNMAHIMQDKTRESPLRIRLTQLARLISKLGYCAAILVAIADLFNNLIIDNNFDMNLIMAEIQNISNFGMHLLHAFTLAITVIVVAVPEGLPMMITIVLSTNMKKMLADNVLVRKLVGIETSGCMNILFTDKTGTLTNGKLQVSKIVTGNSKIYTKISDFAKEKGLFDLYKISVLLNNQSTYSKGKLIGGNGTDRALLESIVTTGSIPKYKYNINSTLPFDSKNKYSMVNITGDKNYTLVKGAPEIILSRCNTYYDNNGRFQTIYNKGVLRKIWTEMTVNKERVVAMAITEINANSIDKMHSLTLVGLVGIKDEIRTESKKAIENVTKAGIQVVMITGDNKDTAVAISREVGILKDNGTNGVVTGQELAKMNDVQVKKIMPTLRVVARALPTDKSRLVNIAQEMGMVTGMTGDGINDAPALKKSDVGFAMGSGTEVAKEAADIVIMDNNIRSISKAILYGRTIFNSIRKFIIFQFVMNLCAVGVSIIAPFIGVDAPVTVIQMLWVNIIMDALAGIAFAGEAPLAEYMTKPPRKLSEPIMTGDMLKQILLMGTYTITLSLVFLKNHITHQLFFYNENETVHFMTCFFALFIFCGVFNSFNARTTRINILSNIKENPLFILIMLSVVVIQIFLIYFGGSLFRTVEISSGEIIQITLIALSVIPVDIIRKLIKKKYKGKRIYKTKKMW